MSVHLTALGLVSALGQGKRTVADRLFGEPRSGLVPRDDFIPGRTAWVGAVTAPLPAIPAALRRYDCRNNRLALAALSEIAPEIEAARGRYGAGRIAVILGTSTSGIAEGEAALGHRLATGAWPSEFSYSRQEPGNLAAFVADYLELEGPAYTIHTACSSSGKAFAAAQRLIAVGLCDAALVGGADSLCRLTLNGFHALEALSPEPCNPFSAHRSGTSIGEGAALFLLEPRRGPVALLGVGESSDAHHVSAPDPAGAGARLAIERALAAAGLGAEAIGYVNLHGTATPLNDVMEGRVVAGLFGASTPCSSTKGLTGHTLGAAAATEAAFLWLALSCEYGDLRLPPHLWDGAADPAIPALRLVAPGDRLAAGGRVAMLSNSFAFGGSNVALVLGRTPGRDG
jgi:3-oxoacyl-[acyl-carrier-protein] synthase-1